MSVFACFLSREALDDIGLFDEVTFPRGYGEENDWCMRASAAGFCHLLDDATFVYHEGGVSFGEGRRRLEAENYHRLLRKHPSYHARVYSFLAANPLRTIQRDAARAAEVAPVLPIARILICLHSPIGAVGGTEAHTRDLLEALSGFEITVVWPEGEGVALETWREGALSGLDFFRMPKTQDETVINAWWRRLLRELRIDLVHVQRVLGHRVNPVAAANALDIPVLFVWHDYYLLCPSYTLLDRDGGFCDWCVDLRKCDECLGALFNYPRGFQREWRSFGQRFIDSVSLNVFPSRAAFEGTTRIFTIDEAKAEVIPHGVSVPAVAVRARPPDPGKPLRVAFVGVWTPLKGSEVFSALIRRLGPQSFEWHVFGAIPAGLEGTVPDEAEWHGDVRTRKSSPRCSPTGASMSSCCRRSGPRRSRTH